MTIYTLKNTTTNQVSGIAYDNKQDAEKHKQELEQLLNSNCIEIIELYLIISETGVNLIKNQIY